MPDDEAEQEARTAKLDQFFHRRIALELAIESHGPAPGKESDACFTGRAKHFLTFLESEEADRA